MAESKRLLPSEHAQRAAETAAERQRIEAQAAAIRERLQNDVNAILQTEEGRRVWAWVFNRCGYNKSILMSSGEVLPLRTECLAAQREVYRDLRELAAPELLARAEYLAERGRPFPEGGVKKKGG